MTKKELETLVIANSYNYRETTKELFKIINRLEKGEKVIYLTEEKRCRKK